MALLAARQRATQGATTDYPRLVAYTSDQVTDWLRQCLRVPPCRHLFAWTCSAKEVATSSEDRPQAGQHLYCSNQNVWAAVHSANMCFCLNPDCWLPPTCFHTLLDLCTCCLLQHAGPCMCAAALMLSSHSATHCCT